MCGCGLAYTVQGVPGCAEDRTNRVVRALHYTTAHHLLQCFRTIVLPCTPPHGRRTDGLARVTKLRPVVLRRGMFAAPLVQTATDYPGSSELCLLHVSFLSFFLNLFSTHAHHEHHEHHEHCLCPVGPRYRTLQILVRIYLNGEICSVG